MGRLFRCAMYVPAVLAVLSLHGLAVAAPEPQAAAFGADALWVDGSAMVEGSLKGLHYQHRSDEPPRHTGGFMLEAETLEVDRYWNLVLEVPPGIAQHVSEEPNRIHDRFQDARVVGKAPQDEYGLDIVPTGETSMVVRSSCVESRLPPDQMTAGSYVNGDALVADVGRGLQLHRFCDQTSVEIRGSFTVSLWKWNGTIHSEGRSQEFWTGTQWTTPQPRLPSAPVDVRTDSGVGNDTQVFLRVTNGSLAMTLSPQGAAEVYAGGDIQGLTTGLLSASNAQGRLGEAADHLPLDDTEVHLKGQFRISATNGQRTMLVDVRGQPETLWADGQNIPLVPTDARPGTQGSTTRSIGSAWAAALSVGAVAGVLMGGGGVVLAQRLRSAPSRRLMRAHTMFARAQELEVSGDPDAALRACRKAIRLNPRNVDQFALRARCHFLRGDFDAALRDHQFVHEGLAETDDTSRGWNAFEAARVCARTGRDQEASAWLRTATAIDPEYRGLAGSDPDLARIRPERVRPNRIP